MKNIIITILFLFISSNCYSAGPQKAKLAREISQTIKPSNIDEYIKIRTEVAETSPSTVRIVQQEDLDMKQGIGALYKST